MTIRRDEMPYDVVAVGGDPAGGSTAIGLKQCSASLGNRCRLDAAEGGGGPNHPNM